jgi:hypothetical protein
MYPSLQPVIAKAFEKPEIIIVLSLIPAIDAIEQNDSSYVSSA